MTVLRRSAGVSLLASLAIVASCDATTPYRVVVANPCEHPLKAWLMYEDARALVGASNSRMEVIDVPENGVRSLSDPLFPTDFGLLVSIGGPPTGSQTAGVRLARSDALDFESSQIWVAVIPEEACR